MKRISTKVDSSQVYTNHCIRATSVAILNKGCMETHHVMAVSGLKWKCSVRSLSRTDVDMKRKMSSILSEFCKTNKESSNFGIKFMEDVSKQKESNLQSVFNSGSNNN